jgi:hypothetical protein
MFYFLKGTGYPPLQNMTLDDYAKSELIENNWLGKCCVLMPSIIVRCSHLAHSSLDTHSHLTPTVVRILSESMTGPIDMDNLDIGKYGEYKLFSSP